MLSNVAAWFSKFKSLTQMPYILISEIASGGENQFFLVFHCFYAIRCQHNIVYFGATSKKKIFLCSESNSEQNLILFQLKKIIFFGVLFRFFVIRC